MKNLNEALKKSDLIKKAYDFGKEAHRGQKRKNGEPYFNHCIAAAESVIEWGLDEQTAAAALLHDAVEDTDRTLDDIRKNFGDDVAFLVDGVTKVGKVKYRGIEAKVENLRKFILYLSKDIRVILVKLADRLHNMRTLYAVHPQKQKRIALETTEIYAPLAYRLGMQKLSGELEDLAFPYIYPQEYKWLMTNIRGRYEEREKYSQKFKPLIEKVLQENDMDIIGIDSRAKRYSSLYKKLLRYDMNIDHIYDLVAIRALVPSIEDCYAAMGIIHKNWPPVPGRIKDYIALPKPNGYRSLHTVVFGPDEKLTEIQIRTPQMHDEAENGIAAHFAYQRTKGTKNYIERRVSLANKKELMWIKQLKNWQNEFTGTEEFLQSLKIDFFKDRILALTPKGEVIDLPAGATPVDFAYQIHSQVGNRCVGAKINNRITPLDSKLQSGDVVEIIVQKNKNPSASWLNFVKTSHARNHIKIAIKNNKTSLIKKVPQKLEFKLTVENGIGLLRNITQVISRSHIDIKSVNTQENSKSPIVRLVINALPKNKTEKLSTKLKNLKGVKEVSYRSF
ncbi:MAG: RelA/SpoT family protein [bacterium]|nr:RelA/SpoT family protein [bacterium]